MPHSGALSRAEAGLPPAGWVAGCALKVMLPRTVSNAALGATRREQPTSTGGSRRVSSSRTPSSGASASWTRTDCGPAAAPGGAGRRTVATSDTVKPLPSRSASTSCLVSDTGADRSHAHLRTASADLLLKPSGAALAAPSSAVDAPRAPSQEPRNPQSGPVPAAGAACDEPEGSTPCAAAWTGAASSPAAERVISTRSKAGEGTATVPTRPPPLPDGMRSSSATAAGSAPNMAAARAASLAPPPNSASAPWLRHCSRITRSRL